MNETSNAKATKKAIAKQLQQPPQPTNYFNRLSRLNVPPAQQKHPKYVIEDLLNAAYGTLNRKQAITALATACGVTNIRTVQDWLKIEAGSHLCIHHLVMPSVLAFFEMQSESQLFTAAHKELLNQVKPANHE